MSNADPASRTPPTSGRPPAAVFALCALLLPLALAAALVVPWAAVRTVDRWPGLPGVPGVDPGTPVDGGTGLGDPYFPTAGNGGYDVNRYVIDVNWDPAAERLTGSTVIEARATQPLRTFAVDLALDVRQVRVNGEPATFERVGPTDVVVTPLRTLATDADFTVEVSYAGRPDEIPAEDAEPSAIVDGEWTVAGEPTSASWWFPVNEHPSDPALFDTSIRVPVGWQAIAAGRLESTDRGTETHFDTWHYVSRQPTVSYATFVSVGRYELRQGEVDGLPYAYAVSLQLPAERRERAFAAMATSAERLRVLAEMFGPYPFTELGGVVPARDFGFDGLETQSRPVYKAESITNPRYAPELVTHELAHMWFGDSVTLRQWDDIFLNEAYASWAWWGYRERTGGGSADDVLDRAYERTRNERDFWRVTMIDPGRDELFSSVYLRGPMTLQALRNVMGDEAFSRFSREWAQRPGSRSLEEWLAAAQAATSVDLGPFFQAWIYAERAPARTTANGFRL